MVDGAHGSMWNSASAAVTSDCSSSMCVGHSTMFTNVVSSKNPSVFTHSQAPSDTESYNTEALKSVRGSTFEASRKDKWMYRSAASRCEGPASDSAAASKCEGTASECSEVTYSRTSSVSMREFEGVSYSGKATHIISRREKSSLNPKWSIDEASVKDAFGSDVMLRENRLEGNSSLHSTSRRRGFTFFPMASESGSSCATRKSFSEEIRPKQRLSDKYGSVSKESFAASHNVNSRAEGLVGPRAQERSEGLDNFSTSGHFRPRVDLHSPFLHKGKTEELGPSYVLSSGRLSLEEEARLGRRAPTIDHDFEEYFSSLMLE
ncbi:hypothetical protein GOP47_0022786 [Adiantum capillus-veneris]|uniref:Uncharacterized protein n=1 Tax=Adiantum capillus-veneris TaxID=13818 RepID=A0A9D4U757_ADICA|nr:hypothetical protein GOP47_0022786 [Adiantum capillus-veneris]